MLLCQEEHLCKHWTADK